MLDGLACVTPLHPQPAHDVVPFRLSRIETERVSHRSNGVVGLIRLAQGNGEVRASERIVWGQSNRFSVVSERLLIAAGRAAAPRLGRTVTTSPGADRPRSKPRSAGRHLLVHIYRNI